MPRFFTMLAKHYDPANVDKGMFSMFAPVPHSVPVIATSEVDPNSGIVTVDGKPVSKGKCIKFEFSPLPFYFVPVGEVAREFGKTYTVRLTGFRSKKGKKFAPCTFRLTTAERGTDDGKHKDNEATAKQVSDEGIVLLKNDGALPLAEGERIALLGAYQDFRISAVGASLIKPRWQLTLEEALVQRASFKLSENADTALYIISSRSGENQDNKPVAGEYYLTEREKAELSSAVKIYKRVILILNTGYPVEMKFISSLSLSAIIWTGFCGQRGTESLADILCGRVNPSGRLADTWPYDYYDISEGGSVSERTQMVPRSEVFPVRAKYQKPTFAELPTYRGARISFSDIKAHPEKLDDFVSQFSLKELVDFTVCNGSCFGPKQSGAAGKLAHSDKYGIPTYYMSDGNCGVNLNRRTTGFPSSNVLAGTFNKQLAYQVGEVLAKESKEYGIVVNLGPGGNLHRNLLCGRHPEYFSEDPILAGTLMAYQARGQEENGVRATYKHFLANGSELERKSSHSIMNERTLRELYLRVFDKAFSLYKPSCVMTSYNAVNGIYPSESAPLLHDLLRKRWDFDGFIMTDWGACDTADAVRSVNAGTDHLTPGDKKLFKKIYSAAKRGEISKGTLQNSVKQIIKVLLQCE